MFALAPLAAADGPTDLPFVKLTGLVLGAMILWWAIRRLFGGGKPKWPRSGWMSGPVLASATTRLRLRSGEDVSAYAQATGTDTSCWPSKVTTSTEATSAGATRAVPSSTVPCFSPVGE